MRPSPLCGAEWREKIGPKSQQPVAPALDYAGSDPQKVLEGGMESVPCMHLPGSFQQAPCNCCSEAEPLSTLLLVWGIWIWTKWLAVTLILGYSAQDTLKWPECSSSEIRPLGTFQTEQVRNTSHFRITAKILVRDFKTNCSLLAVNFPWNQTSWGFSLFAS